MDPQRPGSSYVGAPINVDAVKAGFNNIGEYMAAMPRMIQEQRNTQAFVQDFRQKMQVIAQQHKQLDQQYAEMERKTRDAMNRLKQVGPDDNGPQIASRKPGATELPNTPAAAPAQIPNLAGLNFPSFAQNQAEPEQAPANRVPASQQPAFAKINEALPSLDNNLESGRNPDGLVREGSTIATKENRKDDDDGEAPQKITSGKLGASGASGPRRGKSLRDQLKEKLAKKGGYSGGESGSQSATRALLAEADKVNEGSKGADSTESTAGAGGNFTNAPPGGGASGPGFSTSNFGQADLKNGAFNINDGSASAQAQRLRGELAEEKGAPEILSRESQDLFERVRVAHQRSQKDGRVALLKR